MPYQRLLMLATVSLFFALGVGLWAIATPEASAAPPERIEICHIPPLDPDNVRTILVGPKAAAKHFVEHGDFEVGLECAEGVGECEDDGVTICVAGDDTCSATPDDPPEPTEMSCADGLDNDCDGIVDECSAGQICNEATGQCEVDPTCPCFTVSDLQGLNSQCDPGVPSFCDVTAPSLFEVNCVTTDGQPIGAWRAFGSTAGGTCGMNFSDGTSRESFVNAEQAADCLRLMEESSFCRADCPCWTATDLDLLVDECANRSGSLSCAAVAEPVKLDIKCVFGPGPLLRRYQAGILESQGRTSCGLVDELDLDPALLAPDLSPEAVDACANILTEKQMALGCLE